jgi:hypothetical protein
MQPNDTAPDVSRKQVELLRSAGFERRASLTCSLTHSVIALSRRALRERMAGASERDVLLRWVALNYGEDLAVRVAKDLSRRER